MGRRLARLRRVLEKEDVRSISRRYFIANGFDGTLTSIGVVVGAYLSGIDEGLTVVAIGLGAAVGLGTSGVWSVWEIERAQALAEQERIEQAMLTELEDTRVQREHRAAQIVHATASATGPILAILLTLSPLVLEGVVFTMAQSVLASIAVGVAILAAFGIYLASISKQRWYVAAVRMGLAGIVVAGINVFLPG
ncbi:VIT1/CCC1 transporter family protein [Natrarchaeobaculum sulfurireducens]|uniref:Fe2+/Mn2+ transporter, VIT1/CCC1 family n=1 Tax=Natrarchaeobaculum sulfurireducens TaxID=2044521 RepID=A0A346PA46_9EURY|nr:VIT1/CCC1 transporter family protein [Natrarchaeobaculum sulfurireducens]AXR76391.1 Fe2+/Mn2+ transporter, VIT1/CCC1 family [Natrarchaeobaculum sulfurireducens]